MLYDSTKTLIRGMLRDLETIEAVQWDDQAELGRECLYEIHQMTRPQYKGWRADAKGQSKSTPEFAKATRAIPFIKSMVSAIRRKDQVTAVTSGRAALAEM
jgi:hypothetical protein